MSLNLRKPSESDLINAEGFTERSATECDQLILTFGDGDLGIGPGIQEGFPAVGIWIREEVRAIGEVIPEDKSEPLIVLRFARMESIDVLIKALKVAKADLKEQLAQAQAQAQEN